MTGRSTRAVKVSCTSDGKYFGKPGVVATGGDK